MNMHAGDPVLVILENSSHILSLLWSKYQTFKVSGSNNHTLNGLWDQGPQILGTWTLWVTYPTLIIETPRDSTSAERACKHKIRTSCGCFDNFAFLLAGVLILRALLFGIYIRALDC